MAQSCDIIPRIKNKNGEWTDSLLFTSLLENLKDRELAKKAYEQVHSKEFLNWFGDWINNPAEASKVVDENGEPLVMYHGAEEFKDEFIKKSLDHINQGLFFTNNKETTKSYGDKLHTVFLNARNPEHMKNSKYLKGELKDTSKDSGYMILPNYIGVGLETDGNKLLYVVFEPNQIKSISSEGFSKESNNIYASLAEDNSNQEAEQKLGLRHKDGSRKRIDKKKFESTHKQVIKLNKSGKIPQGYRATRIEVKGEKGDSRMYDAIAIKPIASASQAHELSSDMKNIFSDSEATTVKEALEKIAKEDNKVTKILANKLLRYLSNDTKIVQSSLEEMQAIKGNQDNIGGLYDHNTNTIHIRPDMPSRILLHEILHAFTVKQLRSNSQASKDLNSIYTSLKKSNPELTSKYAMTDLDEFLVGIFTDPKFIAELQSTPSSTNKALSVWDDIMNVLAEVLSVMGFSKDKSKSILEESMDAAIRIIEDAKNLSDSQEEANSDEAFDTSSYEDVYASLAPEEQAYYETQTMNKKQEETMKSVIANQNMGLNADGSFYVRKENGKDKENSIEYIRVSDKLENGFDDHGLYEINREAGNDVDSILSDVIVGKSFKDTKDTPRIDNDVKKDIYDYFTRLKSKLTADGSVIMTQQIFSNDDAAVAGATDIILIKPNGKLEIYDLKTSTTSTIGDVNKVTKDGRKYTTSYVKGFNGKKSKKQVHTEQQSMYKRLAQLQGLEVDGLHIVPINIKIKKGKVVTIKPEPIIDLEYAERLVEGLIPDDISQAKSLNDLIEPEKKSLEKIRERLSTLINHWKKKEQGEVAEVLDKLSELKDKMDTVDELQSIHNFIRDAAEIVEGFERTMKSITKDPHSKASIIKLGNINTFMDTFEVLTDIQNLMYRDSPEGEEAAVTKWKSDLEDAKILGEENEFRENNPFPGIKSTIDNTINKLKHLKSDYLIYGRKAYAKLMFDSIPKDVIAETKRIKKELLAENKDSARAAGLITSVLDMERELANSSEDINAWSRWMGSAAGDENAIIALTSLMIKNKLEPVTEALITDEAELGSILETYLKESGKSRDNVVKLNEDVIETIETNKRQPDGSWKKVKHKQFVDKTDWKKFSEAQSLEYKRLEEDGVEKDSKEHNKAINKWHDANTQIKANFKYIIADRKANLTPYEFKLWTAKNYPNKVAKGELREPNNTYTSSKWNKLYDSSDTPISAAGRYHQGLMGKYNEFINQLEYKDRIALTSKGYRLPSVPKGDWERIYNDKELKGVAKDKFRVTSKDTNYKHNEVLDVNGEPVKEIPKFYVNEMEADEVSSDVFESLLMASKNWRYFKAKSEIQAEVQLVRDLVDSQTVDKSDSLGNAIHNSVSTFFKGKAKINANDLAAKLNDHLDVVFYGSEDLRQDAKIGNQVVSVDKGVSNLMWASSMISLTGNIISGMSNATLGNLTNLIETSAGEYLTPKALAKAIGRYTMSMGTMALDVNRLTGKSIETQLSKLFDFDQAYIESVGNNVSGSRSKQILDSSTLGFVNNGAEYEISTTAGFAFLESIKWIDGSFQNRKDYLYGKTGTELKDAKKKFDESSESLLDAYELDKAGIIKLKDKYTLPQSSRSAFKNKLHEMNKYNHGNYAKHDKVALQRRWYGKLALFFRKHIQPGLAKRFGRERINYALGGSTEGMYTATGRASIRFIKDLSNEMKVVGFMEAFSRANKNITESQRANMRRTFYEGLALVLTIAAVGMLGADDDDEPNTWAENLLLLQARRLQSELSFYNPLTPLEAFRTIKSPTVSMGTVEAATRFVHGLVTEWGDDNVYKRDTGFWDKGDNKDIARLAKLIPGLKSIIALLTPEEQIKTFNKLTL